MAKHDAFRTYQKIVYITKKLVEIGLVRFNTLNS